jgi:hypothetical protein
MNSSREVPELLLELAAQQDPGALSAEELSQRGGCCASDIEARIASLQRSNQELLVDYPPSHYVRSIEARLRCPDDTSGRWPSGVRRMALAGAALAAGLLAALMIWPVSQQQQSEGLRPKGGARLLVYRQAETGPMRLDDGDQARAGDVLQLGFVVGESRHAVLLSVDGGGSVSLHFPRELDAGTKTGGQRVLLPYSFELDDAPRFERFLLICSERPLDVRRLMRQARTLTEAREPLSAPPGVTVSEVLLRKDRTVRR